MDDNSTTKKYKFHQNNIDQQIIHSKNSDNIWVIKDMSLNTFILSV